MLRRTAAYSDLQRKVSAAAATLVAVTVFIAAIMVQRAEAQELPSMTDSVSNLRIATDGALWLEGNASIVDYRCYAETLAGSGNIENTAHPTENIKGESTVKVRVTIPVHTLECGKTQMNRDLYEALKAEQHPKIAYELINAEFLRQSLNPDSTGWMKIRTRGLLTIAGVTNTISMVIDGQMIGSELFRVRGAKPINMKDYQIVPPTALMGLIKVNEKLTVHFDVSVHLERSP